MADMRNLKKFSGNKDLGDEFMFLPVEAKKYKVSDIPNLPANRVQVCAIINQGKKVDPKTGKRVRPLRPMICLVSDIPDKDQVKYILDLRQEKKLEIKYPRPVVSELSLILLKIIPCQIKYLRKRMPGQFSKS